MTPWKSAAFSFVVLIAGVTGCASDPEPAPSPTESKGVAITRPATPEARFEAALERVRAVAPTLGATVRGAEADGVLRPAPAWLAGRFAGLRVVRLLAPGRAGKHSVGVDVWLAPQATNVPLQASERAPTNWDEEHRRLVYAGTGLYHHWFVLVPAQDKAAGKAVADGLQRELSLDASVPPEPPPPAAPAPEAPTGTATPEAATGTAATGTAEPEAAPPEEAPK